MSSRPPKLSTKVKAEQEPGQILRWSSLAFGADGRTLAAGTFSQGARVLDLSVLPAKTLHTIPDEPEFMVAVALWPDCKTLATGGFPETVYLWDAAPGKARRAPDGTELPLGSLEDKNKQRRADTLTFSPDGRTLVVGWDDGRVVVWELATRRPRVVLQSANKAGVFGVAFSPNGKLLATAHSDGEVAVWAWGEKRWSVRLPGAVYGVAWAPDGRHLATANINGTVYIFRIPDSN